MSHTAHPLVALVPVRAGSKGLPGKNTRLLAGKPLYRHAIDQALAAGAGVVIVSTDIASILDAEHDPRVRLLERPTALAGDAVPMDPVIAHALAEGWRGPARVALLQATSPLRLPSDIEAAVALHRGGAHDLVMSVTAADRGVLKWGRLEAGRFVPLGAPEHPFTNRQALPPVLRPNGAVYVFDAEWFRGRGTLACERIGVIEMPAERSGDIDSAEDFARAEAALAARGADAG